MKASWKRNAGLVAMLTGVATFSTGCNLEELPLEELLTIARIVALFI